MPTKDLAPGVVEIDTLLGGWQRITAGYLIDGPRPVLVETGSQSSAAVVLLPRSPSSGSAPTSLPEWSSPTSTSTTRAASATWPAPFPRRRVYVHEKGARHLVDPSRLVRSAEMVYGPLLDSLFGRLDPTPPERVHVLVGRRGDRPRRRARPPGDRLARPRQAPPRAHRLARRGFSSPATPSGCACPTGACCARRRRRPTSISTPRLSSLRRVRRAPPERYRPCPLRSRARSIPRTCSRRRRRPCWPGPRRPSAPGGPVATWPTRCSGALGKSTERAERDPAPSGRDARRGPLERRRTAPLFRAAGRSQPGAATGLIERPPASVDSTGWTKATTGAPGGELYALGAAA